MGAFNKYRCYPKWAAKEEIHFNPPLIHRMDQLQTWGYILFYYIQCVLQNN